MEKERRCFFRTDDVLSLHTRSVSEDDLSDHLDSYGKQLRALDSACFESDLSE